MNQGFPEKMVLIGKIYLKFKPLTISECLVVSGGLVQYYGTLNNLEKYLIDNLNVKDLDFNIVKQKSQEAGFSSFTYNYIKFIFLDKQCSIIPGFVDSHIHPSSGGIQSLRLSVQDCVNWTDAKAKIAKNMKELNHSEGQWIFVYGYSQGWFKEIEQNIDELDSLSPNNPLIIMRDDCHAYWCNSHILKISKITLETAGIIGRYKETLNGFVSEGAMNIIRKYFPKMDKAEQRKCLLEGLNIMLKHGITAFQDAAVKESVFEQYLSIYSDKELSPTLPFGCLSISWNSLFLEQTQTEDEQMKIGVIKTMIERVQQLQSKNLYCHSVKLFVDGVVESRSALMNVNYCQCNHKGELMIADLKEVIHQLYLNKIQAHMHSIGDAATDLLIKSYSEIQENDQNYAPQTNYIAHLQFVTPEAIQQFPKLKLGANFSPLWFYESPELSILNQALPQKYQESMYPVKRLAQLGVTIGFGSDWPVSSINPFFGIEVAVTRQPLGHSQGFVPIADINQKISLEEALYFYTEGSAQLIQQSGKGELPLQGQANFIIISQDLFQIKPHLINETVVYGTFINGNIAYDGGIQQMITELF